MLPVGSSSESRPAGGSGGFGQENVGAVEVTEVANPVRVENRLAPGNRQRVESADRAARIVFQVVEIRRVVALVDALHHREVDLHQIFDPVENAPDVFRVEMACHLFHRPVQDQINVQLGAGLRDSLRESHAVVFWLQRTRLHRQMLLQVGPQIGCLKLGAETEIILDDHRLHIRVEHHAEDAVFKARHRYRLIDKGVFRTAKLPKFVARLAHLFRGGVVANDQDFEVGLGQIARVEVVLHQALVALLLSFLPQLPGICGATVGAGDDRPGDAGAELGKAGVIVPAQRLLQCGHQRFPGIGVERLEDAEMLEQVLHLRDCFLGG